RATDALVLSDLHEDQNVVQLRHASTLPSVEIRLPSFPSNQFPRTPAECPPRTQALHQEIHMSANSKTVIVTGASQGIGAAVANLFLERGYNVVATSRHISKKNELQRSDQLALVDGDIGLDSTAATLLDTAVKRFGSVDALVNNAGIFISKPFMDYTLEDF